MEHIVQFAIGIDDEAIRKRIERTAETQIIDSIKSDVTDQIFRKSNWKNETQLHSWVKDIVVEAVLEHKDDIIKSAAMELCEYMKRTKAVREAVAGAVEDSK
jgi:hypothetical protein